MAGVMRAVFVKADWGQDDVSHVIQMGALNPSLSRNSGRILRSIYELRTRQFMNIGFHLGGLSTSRRLSYIRPPPKELARPKRSMNVALPSGENHPFERHSIKKAGT